MNGKSGIIPGNYVEADGGAETVVSASLQVLFRSGGGGKNPLPKSFWHGHCCNSLIFFWLFAISEHSQTIVSASLHSVHSSDQSTTLMQVYHKRC